MDPSSSSSSSSNKRKLVLDCCDDPCYKRPKYDVFVNYEPDDIGKGFVSHLKGALGCEGVEYCDNSMLPIGQDKSSELSKAIEDSEIYLIVFSPKYASYKECLDEFALIMETYRKFKKRKIFPIFFDVDASHVRNQQGSFLEAFEGYEKDVDPVSVQIWRQALKEVGEKSGLNLKDWRDEEQLKREIMTEVRKMKSPGPLSEVEHRVGIDSRAQDVISALRLSSNIVSVLGVSGSGKTAVVKAVYNKISADFDVSCFIQDINTEYSGHNWKVHLQKKVISFLTDKYKVVARHNDRAAKIKELISRRKLFLVLDDVYTFEQLQALSIPSAPFHCESRILVTTRNMQLLSNLQHTSYHMKLFDPNESFELFTRLIGQGDHVDKKFVDAIVQCAGGLPLVLEVWSGYFNAHDRKDWPNLLEMLKRIPHEDTQKKLRISYDSLPKRAQNLFLDIACFFHGWGKGLVIKILQEEYLFPDIEIKKLVHKFLVIKNEPWERVSLHHVIREMGQEVVRKEDEDEPGRRTRLMGYRDVVRVLGDCSGTTNSVRSIKLDDSDQMEERATVDFEALKKMTNLRFIMFTNHNLYWPCSCSSNDACFSLKHLKYLEWMYFPCKSLDNFDMSNVVFIKLWASRLEKLWEGVKSLKKLKILDVSWSFSLIKTGSFTGIENLEELNLFGCSNLQELDSSMGCLQKLVKLNLSGCEQLKKLSWEMIGKLTSLRDLELQGCTNIVEISNEVGSNSHPVSLCQLHQLTRIILSNCTKIRWIPNLPPNMEDLCAYGCENLENLPSNISELQNLMDLNLNDCLKLGSEGFTQVTRLRNLETLQMRNCNVSQVSSGIENLVSLAVLDLSGNPFSSLPETFTNLLNLEKLKINDCSELQLLPPLPPQLYCINATKCWSLDVMPFDSMQNAYIFPFKESVTSSKGLVITLSGEEVPKWCIYRNCGDVISFVAPIQFHHTKICGLILCAISDNIDDYDDWSFPTIYNKTKGTGHPCSDVEGYGGTKMVMFYPLNDTTLVLEAGDTVELHFHDERVKSWGLRLAYEDDVVDSSLVLKEVRNPATLSLLPSSSDIMTGNSITEVNDEDVWPFFIQDEEYTDYDFGPFPVRDEEICPFPVRDEEICLFPFQDEEIFLFPVRDEEICLFPFQD